MNDVKTPLSTEHSQRYPPIHPGDALLAQKFPATATATAQPSSFIIVTRPMQKLHREMLLGRAGVKLVLHVWNGGEDAGPAKGPTTSCTL